MRPTSDRSFTSGLHWAACCLGLVTAGVIVGAAEPETAKSAEGDESKPASSENANPDRVELNKYATGAVQAKCTYRGGVLAECTWYRPDGSVLDTTNFEQDKVGWSYRLRDDGTIRMMYQCDYTRCCNDDLLVHGMAIFMSPNQTESIVVQFQDGVCTDAKKYEQAFELAMSDLKSK